MLEVLEGGEDWWNVIVLLVGPFKDFKARIAIHQGLDETLHVPMSTVPVSIFCVVRDSQLLEVAGRPLSDEADDKIGSHADIREDQRLDKLVLGSRSGRRIVEGMPTDYVWDALSESASGDLQFGHGRQYHRWRYISLIASAAK
jgi:hypothetical protein